MSQIEVSVIMPAYNCEKYIEKAIKSVLKQEVNLELIIINDCSKDNLEEVVNKYIKDRRVVYIKNEANLGVAMTRNKGVEMAQGEYIAFIDADDWWGHNKLSKQLKVLKESGCVMCSTARELFTSNGETVGKVIPVPARITYKKMLYGNLINCSSVLIKKDIMKGYNMEYDDAHEDYITWLDILKKHGECVAINEPLLKYRLSPAGKSRNKLKSAKMHYKSLRYAGFGVIRSCFYFVAYAINGVIKHYM
ncbi:MAG: glycosyltransferase family 2 protein [Lachnospiraceae bacterium]|nr:glycosyltransferase family 2 protein [Lachnospiraceae bacterium]